MTWWLLHWQDGDEFLGVNIVESDDPVAAQILANELKIAPGLDTYVAADPSDIPCPPMGRVDDTYEHRYVHNQQTERMVCATCGDECQPVCYPRGMAVVGQLPPLRPMDDGSQVGWGSVSDRLLSAEQLIQLGLGVPAGT